MSSTATVSRKTQAKGWQHNTQGVILFLFLLFPFLEFFKSKVEAIEQQLLLQLEEINTCDLQSPFRETSEKSAHT